MKYSNSGSALKRRKEVYDKSAGFFKSAQYIRRVSKTIFLSKIDSFHIHFIVIESGAIHLAGWWI